MFMQPHFDTLLRDIILPLLSHSDELAEMWEDDPLEYIRYNTTMYVSMHSPNDAAATLIKDACTKRKGILDKSMQYCIQVLNSEAKPEVKDGALHLVGTVYDVLLKNHVYKVFHRISRLINIADSGSVGELSRPACPATISRSRGLPSFKGVLACR